MDNDNALAANQISDETVRQVIDQLENEAPAVATVMQAMCAFSLATSVTRDLYGETYDLRRSHLAVLVGLADVVREHLADVLAEISLGDRLADADTAAPIGDGLDTVAEALTAVAQELTATPERPW